MKPTNIIAFMNQRLIAESLAHALSTNYGAYNINACCDIPLFWKTMSSSKNYIVITDSNSIEASEKMATFSKKLKSNGANNKVICFIKRPSVRLFKSLLSMGYDGLLSFNCTLEEIQEAITIVQANKQYVSEAIRQTLIEQLIQNQDDKLNALSDRELHILELLRKGNNTHEIAAQLNISYRTVEVHRQNILKKCKVKNIAAAINLYTEEYKETQIANIATGFHACYAHHDYPTEISIL